MVGDKIKKIRFNIKINLVPKVKELFIVHL